MSVPRPGGTPAVPGGRQRRVQTPKPRTAWVSVSVPQREVGMVFEPHVGRLAPRHQPEFAPQPPALAIGQETT